LVVAPLAGNPLWNLDGSTVHVSSKNLGKQQRRQLADRCFDICDVGRGFLR
jgi:hypothetical protein